MRWMKSETDVMKVPEMDIEIMIEYQIKPNQLKDSPSINQNLKSVSISSSLTSTNSKSLNLTLRTTTFKKQNLRLGEVI